MCLSTSLFEPFIPSFQPRQQHSLLGSAVSPILGGSSVCCQTKAGGLSLSQEGSWFTLVHFLRMKHSISHRTYLGIRYMAKKYHYIDQPLSSFILRIDPSELPTHARWWIQQTSSVGGRDFSPNFGAASSSLPSQN